MKENESISNQIQYRNFKKENKKLQEKIGTEHMIYMSSGNIWNT